MPSEQLTVQYLSTFSKNSLNTIYQEREVDAIIYILFEHYLGFSKTDCIIQSTKLVDETIAQKIRDAIQRLQQHTPIQYVISKAHFYDLDLYVDNNVLIPRQETEELVNWIINDIKILPVVPDKLNILDIGTGSGCIAIALKNNINFADITAIDISENALNVAKRNAAIYNIPINFMNFDILSEINPSFNQKYDIIVSNPPYIKENEKLIMSKNVLNYEPHQALFVENEDPLMFYKAILNFSLTNLSNSGHIYFEINENYGEAIIELMKKYNFNHIILKKDLNQKDRMISAEK